MGLKERKGKAAGVCSARGSWAGAGRERFGPDRPERKGKKKAEGELGEAVASCCACAGRAGPFGRVGRSTWPSVFFYILKLEIHFEISNKIGKIQMSYR